MTPGLAEALKRITGPQHVITDPLELRTYECDGLTSHRSVPAVVVLPSTAEQTAQIVKACVAANTPFVARGSGTGLSGGAMPHPSGVLIVMSRMRSVLEVDPVSRRAIVEPGVTNLSVSNAVRQYGLFYAPDPSSQVICSVGGNVAENSGGAHCLKYGFTVHHVTGIEIVTPDGELTWIGDGTGVTAGYDLLGAFTGSEGTLGIVTKIAVKLTPLPETIHTLLAAYDSMADGGRAVSDIIAAGVTPAAIEMMDPLAIEAAEAAVQPDYPAGAGAVLIVELDGPAAEVEAELAITRRILAEAIEIRAADDPEQRARIWAGRKSAFAAVGRLAPSFIVQDGVVPRTALGDVLARIGELSAEHGIRVANVFHAGDGNLHPLVLYDDSSPAQTAAAEVLSGAILDACIEHGGSITGEHGVGVDKSRYMPKMFTDADLDTMQLVRCAFDPRSLCNPGKVFPTPRLCGEVPGNRRTLPPGVDIFLWTLRRSPIQPVPTTRSRGSSPRGSPTRSPPRRPRRYSASPRIPVSRSCRAAGAAAWTGAAPHRAATWCSTCPGWTRSSNTRRATWSSGCRPGPGWATSRRCSPGPASGSRLKLLLPPPSGA
jgi:glycolate oxidase